MHSMNTIHSSPDSTPPPRESDGAHRIEIRLRNAAQLFNTMDPSPFHEKDLDRDAEEFIVSWAREYPLGAPLAVIVHLAEPPTAEGTESVVTHAIHHYFAYRGRLKRQELRELLKDGRLSLLVGFFFLSLCLLTGQLLSNLLTPTLAVILRESLTVGGWVAMWRPMSIYLYDWWPIRARVRLYAKLSHIPVKVVVDPRGTS